MTRLWENRQPIEVTVDESGCPVSFKWNGTAYPITRVANTWIVDTGWWLRRIWRKHYKVATRSGMLAIIYHDLVTGKWYLQQIYD